MRRVRQGALAVRGRTPGLRHHNVWFPADYDAEFDAVFGRDARPVDDPTVYVCAPDDDLMRPDADHESWFVLVNAPRHGSGPGAIDWDAPGLADSYRDRVLAVMAERGFDVRDQLDGKTRRLVARIWDLEFIVCETELEALVDRARRLPAPDQRLARPGAVPRERVGAPRRRAAARGHRCRDRGQPRRPRLTAPARATRAHRQGAPSS